MTLTSVTCFDEVIGILVYRGPKEAGVKYFFSGVVGTMMSTSWSFVASLENFKGFLTVNTPPDNLIRANLKQVGVVPKIVFHILEELVLLLGRHPFPYEVTRMIVC